MPADNQRKWDGPSAYWDWSCEIGISSFHVLVIIRTQESHHYQFRHTYLRGNALRWDGFVLMFNLLCSNTGRVCSPLHLLSTSTLPSPTVSPSRSSFPISPYPSPLSLSHHFPLASPPYICWYIKTYAHIHSQLGSLFKQYAVKYPKLGMTEDEFKMFLKKECQV